MRAYIVVYQLPVYVTVEVFADSKDEAEQKAYDYAVHGHEDVGLLSEEWMPHAFSVDQVRIIKGTTRTIMEEETS